MEATADLNVREAEEENERVTEEKQKQQEELEFVRKQLDDEKKEAEEELQMEMSYDPLTCCMSDAEYIAHLDAHAPRDEAAAENAALRFPVLLPD